ncbi:alpha/beta hydrolase [Kordiimonas sp.]|uniref:alpha/beta hydrolase n=1 Tax=Kordiimonas sp. TaxID=1970157 RepID=UPI003A94590F
MASFKSKYWVFMLKLMGKKRNRATVEGFYKDLKKRRASDTYQPPKKLYEHFTITEREVDGFPVFTMKEKSTSMRQHLFYLHGGAYVGEILPQQWEFAAHLAARTHSQVTIPIYPLAPEHTVETTLPFVQKVYAEIEENLGDFRMHVIGDSAGAGLAVAMAAEQVKAKGSTSIRQLILVSPWVDVTMENETIPELDKVDPWLTPVGLKEAGKCYAGEADVRDPRVSPTFGTLEGLPPCHIMIGTRDILLPDARLFASKLADAEVKHSFRQVADMFHCWVMLDMPETRRAREEIIGLLQS